MTGLSMVSSRRTQNYQWDACQARTRSSKSASVPANLHHKEWQKESYPGNSTTVPGSLLKRGGIGVKDEQRLINDKRKNKMAKSVVDQTTNYIGESVRKASEFTSTLADAVEDGLSTARRAAEDGREAVEGFIHDTTKRVKRRPIESILLSLAVGVALGFLVGRATSGE